MNLSSDRTRNARLMLSDSYFVGYLIWGLLPFSLSLYMYSLGSTDIEIRYVHVANVLWWVAWGCYLVRAKLGFLLQGVAIALCWIPSVARFVNRVVFLWQSVPTTDIESWSPGLFAVHTALETTVWLIPTTVLMLIWLRYAYNFVGIGEHVKSV